MSISWMRFTTTLLLTVLLTGCLGKKRAVITIGDESSNEEDTGNDDETPVVTATLGLSASSLAFGAVNTDTTSSPIGVTVSNTGDGEASSLSVSSLSAPFAYQGGSYPGTDGTCGTTLASEASCTLSLVFTPTNTGSFSSTLSLGYNDGSDAQTLDLALTGSGQISYKTVLYTAHATTTNDLSGYELDPSTGQLSNLSSFPMTAHQSGGGLYGMVASPDLKYVYIGGYSTNDVESYKTNGDGSLTFHTETTGDLCTGLYDLAITPDGNTLIAACRTSDKVLSFTLSNGGFSLKTSLDFSGESPNPLIKRLLVHPSGSYLYAISSAVTPRSDDDKIFKIDIASDGTLTRDSGNDVTIAGADNWMIYAGEMAPNGKYLVITDNNASFGVKTYAINTSTGALTLTATYDDENAFFGSDIGTQVIPFISETSGLVYFISQTGYRTIHTVSDDTTGALNNYSSAASNSSAYGLSGTYNAILDTLNHFFYILGSNYSSSSQSAQTSYNPTTGTLTALTPTKITNQVSYAPTKAVILKLPHNVN